MKLIEVLVAIVIYPIIGRQKNLKLSDRIAFYYYG